MVVCSKCGIVVVSGDYVEINNKPVCLACALKKGKLSKKHITGFLERLLKKLPLSLQIIIFLVLLSAIYSLSLSTINILTFRYFGLIIAIIFFALVFGLVFLLNFVRIALIFLTLILIFVDFYLLINSSILNFAILARLVISVIIIIYLLQSKVRKLFV